MFNIFYWSSPLPHPKAAHFEVARLEACAGRHQGGHLCLPRDTRSQQPEQRLSPVTCRWKHLGDVLISLYNCHMMYLRRIYKYIHIKGRYLLCISQILSAERQRCHATCAPETRRHVTCSFPGGILRHVSMVVPSEVSASGHQEAFRTAAKSGGQRLPVQQREGRSLPGKERHLIYCTVYILLRFNCFILFLLLLFVLFFFLFFFMFFFGCLLVFLLCININGKGIGRGLLSAEAPIQADLQQV